MFSFTLSDLLEKNLCERSNHDALVYGTTHFPYEALNQQVESTACWLHDRGIARGDFVGIHLHKSVEEVVATFAAVRLGAVCVNVNYQWTLHQLEYVIHDCGMRALITDQRRTKQMQEVGLLERLELVLVKGSEATAANVTPWHSLPMCSVPDVVPRPIDTDLAALLYTSGSTGKPKGVMLTHLNLVQGARSVAAYLGSCAEDRILSVLPFSFDYGLNQLTTTFFVGGTLVLQPVPMAAEIIRVADSERVTGIAAVPPLWIQLARYLEEYPTFLPHLRYITNSGGKIPASILNTLPEVFPQTDIYLMYGLTEAFRSTYLPPAEYESKKGAIGRAIPNVDIFVVDAQGKVCGPGEQGELIHRGSLVSQGYYRKPEATNERIRSCPALRHLIGNEKVVYSGDIVRIDEDGCLWFVSRADSLIKCSGFRISPTEVEDVVHESKLVLEVVAYGVDHDDLGQVVCIAAQPKDDFRFEQQLLEYCKHHMPHYMIPRHFHAWSGEMPKTGSGKIDRPEVIRLAEAARRGSA